MAAMPGRPDFPGLLGAGFHVLDLNEIAEICVIPFKLSTTRPTLLESLSEVVERFEGAGIHCDLWVDGSFATKKLDPNDVDVVARLPEALYNASVNSVQGTVLAWFDSPDIYDVMKIDAYHFPEHPVGSPNYSLTLARFRYWQDLFGTGRDNSTEKGIIVIQVNGGVQ